MSVFVEDDVADPGPDEHRLVVATDVADELLSPPEALGVLDRVLSRVDALGRGGVDGGTLVLVAADHPVAGVSMGAAAAAAAGLDVVVVDAGVDGEPVAGAEPLRPDGPRGALADADALTHADVERLVAGGRAIGVRVSRAGLVAIGEVGVGNTTVAAALACALTGLSARDAVGLGAGADSAILARKVDVVTAALQRSATALAGASTPADHALAMLRTVGGPEIAVLTGVVLGAVEAGSPVVLDGLAGSLPGLLATRIEPAVQAHLVAGQVSRERAHAAVLREIGLEPLLALRLRAGEGVGACLAASLVLQGLRMRRTAARTQDAGHGRAHGGDSE